MPDSDITPILHAWPFETGKINARFIEAADGRKLLQVRLDLGLLQMELTHRPDGQTPRNAPSLLNLHLEKREKYLQETHASAGFVLSSDECRDLREEAVQFYHRYVALFSLEDYPSVIVDANHNLAICDLCRDHGAAEPDRILLEQFRPGVLMTRTRAEAEIAIAEKNSNQALAILDRGMAELRIVFEEMGHGDAFDQSNEAMLLKGMRDALVPQLPASQRVELEERLRAAIDAENFELAAILRDELRLLKD